MLIFLIPIFAALAVAIAVGVRQHKRLKKEGNTAGRKRAQAGFDLAPMVYNYAKAQQAMHYIKIAVLLHMEIWSNPRHQVGHT